ncbi:hypothetical protein MBSD_n2140 [Mizugakiibacter sediminis]|uniref:Uncharacterized protein n=1 Tax=Mizugakiibacter sediminis TaxID=1475481 RepID=A0A0K8QPK7_9GAMM|nr:hypothetical protein [Mizugakiibacter sediminis]GAP66825.1 hypothetical protein MBSD_n2140 [Mizugakiibacter sediminis]
MCTLALDYCEPVLRKRGIVSPQATEAFRIVVDCGGKKSAAFESARAAELALLPRHSRTYQEIDRVPNPFGSEE